MRQFSKSISKYLVHTLLKFFPYDNKAKYQINRRGSPLMTDSSQTSFTTLLKKGRKSIKKYDFWHVKCETWHVIHNRYGPLGETSLYSSCDFEVKVIPQVLKNLQNVPIDPWTSSITWQITFVFNNNMDNELMTTNTWNRDMVKTFIKPFNRYLIKHESNILLASREHDPPPNGSTVLYHKLH